MDYGANIFYNKKSSRVLAHPAVIRRSAPLAVHHERARVGEDSLVLAFLHHAGPDRRARRLWFAHVSLRLYVTQTFSPLEMIAFLMAFFLTLTGSPAFCLLAAGPVVSRCLLACAA